MLLWADAALSDPFGDCHAANDDDANAASSRSVRPFGWVLRHDGSAGALAKTGGGSSCAADTDNPDDDNAASSRSVRPLGWSWRQAGTAGAALKTGRTNCPGAPRLLPLKYLYESPVNGLMLLSSASATLDAPSASAVATINCLLSEYGLRDMACSFEVAAIDDGSGAQSKAICIKAS